ncbi:patatin-like phospholipase family protein [Silvimonas soli]|uniref:patatin-like phospholipase family protein n=1 Tax=Silvimonas soli TaxID=2980100 RepID=UPI0024B3B673|nr:patatin-like phospholipase family protein [Silvimonas soli]
MDEAENTPTRERGACALVLSGGGARAAYQVGVLLAIARLQPQQETNPFPIICGTSAGAINAAGLASKASSFQEAVRHLARSWLELTPDRIYHAGVFSLAKSAAHWIVSMLAGGLGKHNPRSLLDNAPLREMLSGLVDFDGIARSIDEGALLALSITASGYTSGQSVSFFQAAPHLPDGWQRASRIGLRARIDVEHLMASSAIPLVFPAARINREYFGDGSVRQIAPLSPAIHLGARKMLVVGVAPQAEPPREKVSEYPSLAQVAGHLLNSVFLDAMEADLERVQRVNKTINLLTPEVLAEHRTELRPIEVLTIAPSRPLERLVMPHRKRFPPGLRFLLSGLGAFRRQGSVLSSYLLFHGDYVRQLIRLGYRDAMARRTELVRFLAD